MQHNSILCMFTKCECQLARPLNSMKLVPFRSGYITFLLHCYITDAYQKIQRAFSPKIRFSSIFVNIGRMFAVISQLVQMLYCCKINIKLTILGHVAVFMRYKSLRNMVAVTSKDKRCLNMSLSHIEAFNLFSSNLQVVVVAVCLESAFCNIVGCSNNSLYRLSAHSWFNLDLPKIRQPSVLISMRFDGFSPRYMDRFENPR